MKYPNQQLIEFIIKTRFLRQSESVFTNPFGAIITLTPHYITGLEKDGTECFKVKTAFIDYSVLTNLILLLDNYSQQ